MAGRQVETGHEVAAHPLPHLTKVSARSGERPVDARKHACSLMISCTIKVCLERLLILGRGAAAFLTSQELNLHLGSHMTPRTDLPYVAKAEMFPPIGIFPSCVDPPSVCRVCDQSASLWSGGLGSSAPAEDVVAGQGGAGLKLA